MVVIFSGIIENVRQKSPLVCNMANIVTVADCAAVTTACGGRIKVLSDCEEELIGICDGVNINMGTPDKHKLEVMVQVGVMANKFKKPLLIDPVGVGASKIRTDTAVRLMNEVKFSVIRGNISEIKTLITGSGKTMGVDANVDDKVTEKNLARAVEFAGNFSLKTGAVVAITGSIDIVTDGKTAFCIYNGDKMMSSITGSGCMLSAMMAAFVSANGNNILNSAAAAVCTMGICGERARKRLLNDEGSGSFRRYLIDEIENISQTDLEREARYEIR